VELKWVSTRTEHDKGDAKLFGRLELTGVLEDKHYLREQWEQSGWKVVKDYVELQGISPSRPVVYTAHLQR
jgi:hypothetical protein